MSRPGYSPVPIGGTTVRKPEDSASVSWVKRIAEMVNNILQGKLNAVLQITLTANSATTVVIDARIGPYSGLYLQPLTAHAAAALYSATSVLADLTTQKQGSVTFNHANDANVD